MYFEEGRQTLLFNDSQSEYSCVAKMGLARFEAIPYGASVLPCYQ